MPGPRALLVDHPDQPNPAELSMAAPTSEKRHAAQVVRALQRAYPDAQCALHYDTPLQLLVATILSAQCTDERVNIVTATLFRKYPAAAALAALPLAKLEKEIQSTGFFRNKTKSIRACCQALVDAAVWYTQLDGFSINQILETRLYETGGSPTDDSAEPGSKTSFIDEVAPATAAPGGGSAAAYTAALGAALVEMVAGLTLGRKKYADAEAAMQAIRLQAAKLREDLTQAVDDDAAAFEAVLGTFKLPKETEEQQKARHAAIQIATMNAAHIPLHTVSDAVKVMDLAARCAKDGNVNAISDAATGAALARAAVTAAGYNVRINLQSLDDTSAGQNMLADLQELEKQAETIELQIRNTMEERAQIAA